MKIVKCIQNGLYFKVLSQKTTICISKCTKTANKHECANFSRVINNAPTVDADPLVASDPDLPTLEAPATATVSNIRNKKNGEQVHTIEGVKIGHLNFTRF